jgi:hypothetical protein
MEEHSSHAAGEIIICFRFLEMTTASNRTMSWFKKEINGRISFAAIKKPQIVGK